MSHVDSFALSPEALPRWLNLLALLAKRVPEIESDEHVACVIAPPSQVVIAALALSSVQRQDDLAREFDSSQGRVASVVELKLRDLDHAVKQDQEGAVTAKRLGGYQLPNGTPPLMILPSGFPARSDEVVPEKIAELLTLSSSVGAHRLALWHYFELCAKPVVVVCQHPEALRSQLESLAGMETWWSNQSLAASLDAAISADDWFRRPVVFATPSAIMHRPWLKELTPAAVIVAGYAAWCTDARWMWPNLPHFLILNVRHDDVLKFRAWHDGQSFSPINSALNQLTGTPGMPTKIFTEHQVDRMVTTDEAWEEDFDFD